MRWLGREKKSIDGGNYKLPSMEISKRDWIEYSIENFYKQIFYDILSVTIGISDTERLVMYNNSNIDYSNKFGLVHYLVGGYVNSNQFMLRYNYNMGKPFVERDMSMVISEEEVISDGVARVDFRHFSEPFQMRQLFALQHSIICFMHAGMSVSSTPAIKIDNMRNSVTTSNKDFLQKQIQDIGSAFKKAGNIITLDGGDSIEFSSMDAVPAEKLNDIVIGMMSAVTRLPKSYIGANRSSSLGDSGEADEKQFFKGISRYFHEIFKPVTDKLLGSDIQLSSVTREKISWQLEALNQLDTVDIDESEKEMLKQEILNAK